MCENAQFSLKPCSPLQRVEWQGAVTSGNLAITYFPPTRVESDGQIYFGVELESELKIWPQLLKRWTYPLNNDSAIDRLNKCRGAVQVCILE